MGRLEFIDILVQAYGDAALLNAQGAPRNFNFLIGTLPEITFPNGGQVPVEAKNKKWNWILFRIPNGTRGSDGSRYAVQSLRMRRVPPRKGESTVARSGSNRSET